MRTNAILAGKCGSRRRSTTSFSENDGENKLSNVRNLIIQRSGEGFTSFNGNKRPRFSGEKKSTIKLSVMSIFKEQARKYKIKCRPRVTKVFIS